MSTVENINTAAQMLSISASLAGAGGMAVLSVIDFPELQSQPASRSLPIARWLFSRGSYIFPQSAEISAVGFAYLAYASLPSEVRNLSQLLRTTNGAKVNGYLAATVLVLGIIPFTRFIMVPNNFAIMDKNEEKGGARSQREYQGRGGDIGPQSRPQETTEMKFTEAEEKEVKAMYGKFISQNLWRSALLGAGGLLGLWTALNA